MRALFRHLKVCGRTAALAGLTAGGSTCLLPLVLAAPFGLVTPATAAAQSAQPVANGEVVTFTVLMRGARVGTQTAWLTKTADGWRLASLGFLGAPFNITTSKLEVTYTPDWQARDLVLEASVDGQPLALTTSLSPSTAANTLVRAGQKSSNVQQVSPRAVVIADNFFGTYEVLAARLAGAAEGSTIPIYRAPEGEVTATVDRVTARRLLTGGTATAIRDVALTLATPRGPVPLEIWVDDRGRLARVVLPISAVVVIRDDLSSVMTREDHGQNPGDEEVFIPGNGFSLAGTITKPSGAARPPAVILVAGPTVPGRDRVSYGVAAYGQLAGRLASAGYFVVRYDARGTGQSGGRSESASLLSYRDDVLAIVQWLRRRRDVDGDRLAVVGYGDSGPIALLAARREDRIKGVALLAAPGRTGREVVLDDQQRALASLTLTEAERAERIALQTRVIDATLSGRGWDGIGDAVRAQADTPWFKTWLAFDPADEIEDLRQPLVILHGALDAEVPPADADRLETLSRARRSPPTHTRKVVVPGANHLLVPATTGAMSEYALLPSRTLVPAVHETLVDWLGGVMMAAR
jgi:pimeloyl-ACP methyl ester carboxylesterase